MNTTIESRALAPAPVPVDLEYTADAFSGAYAAVRSWGQLTALAERVESLAWRWLVVQRRDDPGQRFAQCVSSGGRYHVEVGALDATTGRHAVWRLGGDDLRGGAPGASQFLRIARDWLSLGVVPGCSATRVPLDGDDEPF